MDQPIDRRTFVGTGAAAAATVVASAVGASAAGTGAVGASAARSASSDGSPNASPLNSASGAPNAGGPRRGALRQSVARWCFGGWDLDTLCMHAKACGLVGIDLLSESEWTVPARHGLVCTLANGPSTIPHGFNRPENHDRLIAECSRMIPLVRAAGIDQLIVFSGNRAGMSDSEGLRHCAAALTPIMPVAREHGVTIIMELLNSKIDHGDYMCDRTPWGADLVQAVGSDHFKLLYDIYHMQIMEGDVIRTIRTHRDAIGHFHTAGVPGRNEIDDSQELQYRAIAAAIAETGFQGVVAHEFMPRRDPVQSLGEAAERCRV
ncbi:MAG: TIM barrel protein [Phycisphaeraceae bacterium]|nr:TIM barrel protein [Phycisphaeraceae bacterium]